MTKPEGFTQTSDYGTLKNDASASVSATMPGSQSVGASATVSVTADVVVGTQGASLRARAKSTKDSGNEYVCSTLAFSRTGTVSGSPASYTIYGTLSRISATTVRLTVFIRNPYGSTLTGEAGSEMFTFQMSTFLSPFG